MKKEEFYKKFNLSEEEFEKLIHNHHKQLEKVAIQMLLFMAIAFPIFMVLLFAFLNSPFFLIVLVLMFVPIVYLVIIINRGMKIEEKIIDILEFEQKINEELISNNIKDKIPKGIFIKLEARKK